VKGLLKGFMVCLMTGFSIDTATAASPIKVEIEKTDDGYQLLRGGQPYVVRGAGMGTDDIQRFAAAGGNSIRTWSTMDSRQETRALLDKAHNMEEDQGVRQRVVDLMGYMHYQILLHEFDNWSELLPEQFYYFKGRAYPQAQAQPYALIRDLLDYEVARLQVLRDIGILFIEPDGMWVEP